MEHLQRVWLASRERLPFRIPGSVPHFGDLLMLQLLRPNSSNLPCLYLTFHLEYPLVLSRFCFEEISQLPYSHYIDPVSYDCTNNLGKMSLLVAILTHLLALEGDGQTCYTWYSWLLSNQCCQGTRKTET